MLLFVVLVVVGIGLAIASVAIDDHCRHDLLSFVATILSVILIGCAVSVCIVSVANLIGVTGDTAEMVQEYRDLKYQVDHHMYENDNDVGKKELAEQVMKWNKKITRGKVMKQSIWVSMLYPIDYDQFELIPMESLDAEPKS